MIFKLHFICLMLFLRMSCHSIFFACLLMGAWRIFFVINFLKSVFGEKLFFPSSFHVFHRARFFLHLCSHKILDSRHTLPMSHHSFLTPDFSCFSTNKISMMPKYEERRSRGKRNFDRVFLLLFQDSWKWC